MFKIDFTHINANHLKTFNYHSLFDTEPWHFLDLKVLKDIDLEMNLQSRARLSFEKLSQSPVSNLDIMDILALTTIKNPDWENKDLAEKVANHWWLSLINHLTRQKELLATLIFVLQFQNKLAFYQKFANIHALTALKHTLMKGEKHTWHNKTLEFISLSLVSNNPKNFAEFTLKHRHTIQQISTKYPLPIGDDFKHQARTYWLELYLRLSEKELETYSPIIQSWLNEKTTLEFAITRAKLIFDNPYFSKDLPVLENQTHKFGDIYQWLKTWSKNPDFLQQLDTYYLKILRCWLGAGNYYQLEKIVRKISAIHHESEKGSVISINRYLFWTNYQNYIVDYYLLIPKQSIYNYEKLLGNENFRYLTARHLSGEEQLVPTILLKFNGYYFIQPLVNRGRLAELVMTKDINIIDGIINNQEIDIVTFKTLTPCLIHDFYFGWQGEMAHFLQNAFGILMSGKKIKVADNFLIDYPSELTSSEKAQRKKNLYGWYNDANKAPNLRSPKQQLYIYAKNLAFNGVP